MNSENKKSIAVLIDADNVGSALAGDILTTVEGWGNPAVRRAYGTVSRFSPNGGWATAQRAYGIRACPQVDNIRGKNVADIALVIDAMEVLYQNTCEGICIVSSDSDFTALATKIREGGKEVYGIGGEKTPESFRVACSEFVTLVRNERDKAKTTKVSPVCPRCGSSLEPAKTKSRQSCLSCADCGGAAVKLSVLGEAVAPESMDEIQKLVRAHETAGCICPICGESMSLVRVSLGKRCVEIDICRNCWTVWYDKDEFESLVPQDGVLRAKVSAGKAFRRDTVIMVSSDLRSGRCRAEDIGALKSVLKLRYCVPNPDIDPVISALRSQKFITIDKSGKVAVRPLSPP